MRQTMTEAAVDGCSLLRCSLLGCSLLGCSLLRCSLLRCLMLGMLLAVSVLGRAQTTGAATVPADITLDTLKVQHIDFEGHTQQGVIICNRTISRDLRDIFAELYRQHYPIERIRPISEYENDDERSMRDNNTSCYCYRVVKGSTKLSKHARGLAIDINPLYNPCVRRQKDGTLLIQPATGKPYVDRSGKFKYKITTRDLCYRLFLKHGFRWGGSWKSLKDYQHFEK